MISTEKTISGESGSANLIGELNKIFEIYTTELKTWRQTGVLGEKLSDEKAFDIVIKLLDKSDKIKKLTIPDVTEAKPEAKIRNIQDAILEG